MSAVHRHACKQRISTTDIRADAETTADVRAEAVTAEKHELPRVGLYEQLQPVGSRTTTRPILSWRLTFALAGFEHLINQFAVELDSLSSIGTPVSIDRQPV